MASADCDYRGSFWREIDAMFEPGMKDTFHSALSKFDVVRGEENASHDAALYEASTQVCRTQPQ